MNSCYRASLKLEQAAHQTAGGCVSIGTRATYAGASTRDAVPPSVFGVSDAEPTNRQTRANRDEIRHAPNLRGEGGGGGGRQWRRRWWWRRQQCSGGSCQPGATDRPTDRPTNRQTLESLCMSEGRSSDLGSSPPATRRRACGCTTLTARQRLPL